MITPDGPWRMLLVDDDPLLVALVGDALRLLGHEVTIARAPDEARTMLDEADPHVVLCDLNFTDGQSGAELLGELRDERPWVAAVVLSNHRAPELAVSDAHLLPPDLVYLVKSTVRSVAQIVDAARAAITGRQLDPEPWSEDDGTVVVPAAHAHVLRMLATGATTRALAESRGTSVRAVESLLVRIYGSLGLDTSRDANPRVEAIRMWQSGLIRVRRPAGREKTLVS